MINWIRRLFGFGEIHVERTDAQRDALATQLNGAIAIREQTERFQALGNYRKPAITTSNRDTVREEDNSTMFNLITAAIIADDLLSSSNSTDYSSSSDAGSFDGGGGSSGGAGSEGTWDSGSSDSSSFDSGSSDSGGGFDSSSF